MGTHLSSLQLTAATEPSLAPPRTAHKGHGAAGATETSDSNRLHGHGGFGHMGSQHLVITSRHTSPCKQTQLRVGQACSLPEIKCRNLFLPGWGHRDQTPCPSAGRAGFTEHGAHFPGCNSEQPRGPPRGCSQETRTETGRGGEVSLGLRGLHFSSRGRWPLRRVTRVLLRP